MVHKYSLTKAYKAEQFILKIIDYILHALFRGQENLLRVTIFRVLHTGLRVFLFAISYLLNYTHWESELYDLKLCCLVVALHVNCVICRYLV